MLRGRVIIRSFDLIWVVLTDGLFYDVMPKKILSSLPANYVRRIVERSASLLGG